MTGISLCLFLSGLFIVLSRKNLIHVLVGIELIFLSSQVLWLFYARQDSHAQGLYFALFLLAIMATETAIAIALLIKYYRATQTIITDNIHNLNENNNGLS